MRVQLFALAGMILAMGLPAASQEGGGIPRPNGRPDLTGIYDANTLTQIERPAKYGGREALTDQEATELLRAQATRDEEADKPSDPIGRRQRPAAAPSLERATTTSGRALATASSSSEERNAAPSSSIPPTGRFRR